MIFSKLATRNNNFNKLFWRESAEHQIIRPQAVFNTNPGYI